MGITLKRPVTDDAPRYVPDVRVRLVHMYDIPETLQAHAWETLRDAVHGPGEKWWTVGTYTPRAGETVTVAAQVLRDGSMVYGHVMTPRQMLECTQCADRRPDADVEREGMSRGAQCLFVDCEGTYADPVRV